MTIILVSGALANKPLNGGEAWVRLNWVLGLRKLGFQVYFVEQIGRETCVNEAGEITAFEDCLNLAYFKQVLDHFDLSGSAALLYADGQQTHGLTYAEVLDLAAAADALINISGHLALRPFLRRLHRKVYIDIDPGFTQFWDAAGVMGAHLRGHDFYFTIGEHIGTPACSIPTGGIAWRRTRQPVVLDEWQISKKLPGRAPGEEEAIRFTTIASWRGPYGPVHYDGRTYGLKAHEFRKFVELPARAPGLFEIALDIHPAEERDLRLLRQHGWRLMDPRVVAADPIRFRRYVQTSHAEFSVAQGIYVDTESGWFSDRTVRYLASGKAALVQDTGFSRNLPVGEGLVAFRTLEQAILGAAQIGRDYDRHCLAARALAEEYFDSDKVLGRLIEEIGVAP
jgi:hypothetical protein